MVSCSLKTRTNYNEIVHASQHPFMHSLISMFIHRHLASEQVNFKMYSVLVCLIHSGLIYVLVLPLITVVRLGNDRENKNKGIFIFQQDKC